MNFRENKIELWIGALAAVMIVGLFQAFSGDGDEGAGVRGPEVSYEMPRPKAELVGEFGLGDREIDRRYVNPFGKKKADDAKKAAAAGKQPPAKAPAARPGYGVGVAYVPAHPSASFNVVDKAKSGLSGDGADESNRNGPNADEPFANRTAAGEEDPVNDGKLSPEQWRALLSANPTVENMKKLAEAFLKNEVDARTFYSIVEELVTYKQSASKRTVGFYGLWMVQTAKSFEFVTALLTPAPNQPSPLPDEAKSVAEGYLRGFASASRRNVLLQVLRTGDRAGKVKAAQIVQYALQAGGHVDPRENGSSRNGENQASSASSKWTGFTSIFQTWASGGDAELQGIASQVLSLLPAQQA